MMNWGRFEDIDQQFWNTARISSKPLFFTCYMDYQSSTLKCEIIVAGYDISIIYQDGSLVIFRIIGDVNKFPLKKSWVRQVISLSNCTSALRDSSSPEVNSVREIQM